MTDPAANDVSGKTVRQLGLTTGSQVVSEPWPRFLSGTLDDLLESCPQIGISPACGGR